MKGLFRALSLILPALALLVIVFGAFVRLTDAGLGCPDWPGCYGRMLVPEGMSDIHLDDARWQARPLEIGKAWREMVHRYLAGILGLGICAMAAVANAARPSSSKAVIYALVPLVVFQVVLGMWTVTLLLKPLVVVAHLLGGTVILILLWWNFLETEGIEGLDCDKGALPMLARLAILILIVQFFLGGWTSANYAALACTDFPLCQGQWWPEMDFGGGFTLWRGLGIDYEFGVLETPARTAVHVAHRVGATIVTALTLGVVALGLRSDSRRLRRVAWCILAALAFQLAMGVTNVLGGLPLAAAVAHNAGAALLSISLITLVYLTRRN